MSSMSLIAKLDGESCGDESILGLFGLALWIFLVATLTIGQFVLCEEYFVPVLTALGERLKMSEDVQGATLLAIGTSAPELYTAILGIIFYPSENPGPATNIGSAVFNMCIIIGACAIVAPKHDTKISLFPFLRDSISYFISLILIYVFYSVISPYNIELWEAILLVIWWIVYIIIIFETRKSGSNKGCNKAEINIKEALEHEAHIDESDEFMESDDDNAKAIIMHDMESQQDIIGVQFDENGDPLDSENLKTNNPNNIHLVAKNAVLDYDALDDNLQDLLDDLDVNQRQNVNKGYLVVANVENSRSNSLFCRMRTCFEASRSGFIYVRRKTALELSKNGNKNCVHYLVQLLCGGWTLLFYYLLPKIDGIFATKHMYFTIFMINLWLAVLTFVLIDAAVKIGHCIGMPSDLIGITFLAIGSSISDCIASILVAKQNKMDMAIATAFASNIFDINLCIGISFVIGAALNGNSLDSINNKTNTTDGETFSMLILCAIALLLALWPMVLCSNLRLSKCIGYILIACYVAFISLFSILYLI